VRNAITRRGFGEAAFGAAIGMVGVAAFRHAGAASLPQPTERSILTVTGRITTTNKADAAQFDRPMLEALGMSGFVTTTPWDDGPVRFEGVRMDRLMREVGATGDTVSAYAANDYSVDIPVEDFARYDVLLALRRDGEYMTARNKGPLFIIYPYDSHPELKTRQYYSRSAWQVVRLVVR
jgi:hypothetical protein